MLWDQILNGFTASLNTRKRGKAEFSQCFYPAVKQYIPKAIQHI